MGGYFVDFGYKDVLNLVWFGFLIGEVVVDGVVVIMKVLYVGGCVSVVICKE